MTNLTINSRGGGGGILPCRYKPQMGGRQLHPAPTEGWCQLFR